MRNWFTLESVSKIGHCCILWYANVLFGIILITPLRGILRNKTSEFLTLEKLNSLDWVTALFSWWLASFANSSARDKPAMHPSSPPVRYAVAGDSPKPQYSKALIQWLRSFHHLMEFKWADTHFTSNEWTCQARLLNEYALGTWAACLTSSAFPPGSWHREMPDGPCFPLGKSPEKVLILKVFTVTSVQHQLPLPPPLRSHWSRAQTSWRLECHPWRGTNTRDRVRLGTQLATGTKKHTQTSQDRCLKRTGGNVNNVKRKINWGLFARQHQEEAMGQIRAKQCGTEVHS